MMSALQETYLQTGNGFTSLANKLKLPKGRDKLGAWNWHTRTAIFKIDDQQGPIG